MSELASERARPPVGEAAPSLPAATPTPERPAISVRGLTKVYRLYKRPLYRMLDIFGLCPQGERYYAEHTALEDVSVDVRRGEKVAIIGRNGSGKSTLLKLVTGVMQATRGTVEANGQITALLQIGTGFHLDLTGRENVILSLAHLGITGAAAQEKLEDVIDFAEIDEYVDQPVKTYSTGMVTRLMFAASTAIEPDILICDEVLGVGDSYFAHKSYERMRELSVRHGTTFLLVTHDLYAALNVCTRFLWIDRGRLIHDGNGAETIAAYERSIKEQEHVRLHRSAVKATRPPRTGDAARASNGRAAPSVSGGKLEGTSLRLKAAGALTLDAPLHVARFEAIWPDGHRESCGLDPGGASEGFRCLPSRSVRPGREGDRACTTLLPYGDIFHCLDLWLPARTHTGSPSRFELDYATTATRPLGLSSSSDAKIFQLLATLTVPTSGWQTATVDAAAGASASAGTDASTDRYGTSEVTIEAVRVLDRSGQPLDELRHGDPLRLEVDCLARDESFREPVLATISFHRHGYVAATTFVRPPAPLEGGKGTIVLHLDAVLLTSGEYSVAIGLFRGGYARNTVYFTASPDVLDHLPRGATFRVEDDPPLTSGFAFTHPCRWELRS